MWAYLLFIPAGFLFCIIVLPSFWGGAWSPTPLRIIDQMLEMAGMQEGETLYDLGAGDGRVIIRASTNYRVKAVGVEIDPFKCFLLKARIRLKGLSDRIRVVRSDFFKADLSEADVVFLYLSPVAHCRLRAKLAGELKEGARVVCYRRPMAGWTPEAQNPARNLYLYRITGQMAGKTGSGEPCHQ